MAAKDNTQVVTTTKKNDTQILSHNCVNEWQDQKYGKGLRLMNLSNKGFRCATCGSIR